MYFTHQYMQAEDPIDQCSGRWLFHLLWRRDRRYSYRSPLLLLWTHFLSLQHLAPDQDLRNRQLKMMTILMTFMRELQPSLTQNIRHLSNLVHSLWERTSNAWGSSAPLSVSTAGDHRATLHYVAWQTVEHSHRATSIRSCSLATSTVYCSRIRARYSWKRCGSKCKNHRAQIFIYRHHPKSESDISEIPKKWYTKSEE